MTSRERCPAHSVFACTAIDRGDGRESNLAAVPQHHAGADRQAGGEEKGRRPGTGKVAALIPMKLSSFIGKIPLNVQIDWIYAVSDNSEVEC